MFRKWKPTHAAQHITSLKKADWTDPSNPVFTGEIADTPAEVLKEFTYYDSNLFAKKTTRRDAQLICLQALRDGNRIQPPTAEMLDKDITVEEVTKVLNNLPTEKSPGPDRLPNKFYKAFSSILAPELAKIFNESRDQGALPRTNALVVRLDPNPSTSVRSRGKV